MRSDTSIAKIFSEKEIEGWESMAGYAENMLVKREDEPDINNAYHLFFEQVAEIQERGEPTLYSAPFEETEKYRLKNGKI